MSLSGTQRKFKFNIKTYGNLQAVRERLHEWFIHLEYCNSLFIISFLKMSEIYPNILTYKIIVVKSLNVEEMRGYMCQNGPYNKDKDENI